MALQATGLAFERGQRRLFSGIGFDLQPGQALRVKGCNGSGKTSLLRVLCGLSQPVAGQIAWQGQPIAHQRDAFHQSVVYLGHGQGLKDDLTAWENVRFSSLLAGRACTRTQAFEALDVLGLGDRAHLPTRVLSQGQRRRVLLARLALAPTADKPRLLVLDEPFVALDAESIQVLSALLAKQLADQAMLVYTTHQDQALGAHRVQEIELGLDEAVEDEV